MDFVIKGSNDTSPCLSERDYAITAGLSGLVLVLTLLTSTLFIAVIRRRRSIPSFEPFLLSIAISDFILCLTVLPVVLVFGITTDNFVSDSSVLCITCGFSLQGLQSAKTLTYFAASIDGLLMLCSRKYLRHFEEEIKSSLAVLLWVLAGVFQIVMISAGIGKHVYNCQFAVCLFVFTDVTAFMATNVVNGIIAVLSLGLSMVAIKKGCRKAGQVAPMVTIQDTNTVTFDDKVEHGEERITDDIEMEDVTRMQSSNGMYESQQETSLHGESNVVYLQSLSNDNIGNTSLGSVVSSKSIFERTSLSPANTTNDSNEKKVNELICPIVNELIYPNRESVLVVNGAMNTARTDTGTVINEEHDCKNFEQRADVMTSQTIDVRSDTYATNNDHASTDEVKREEIENEEHAHDTENNFEEITMKNETEDKKFEQQTICDSLQGNTEEHGQTCKDVHQLEATVPNCPTSRRGLHSDRSMLRCYSHAFAHIISLTIFLLAWWPFQIALLLKSIFHLHSPINVGFAFIWVGLSSGLLNMIVYPYFSLVLNRNFRILWRQFCVKPE